MRDPKLQGLSIAAFVRTVPAGMQESSIIASLLGEFGCPVTTLQDAPWSIRDGRLLLILGNARWFPTLVGQLTRLRKSERPPIAIWHWEPLPPPNASGLSWPVPTLREIGKIVLRDRRTNDVYSNYGLIRRLARTGIPDVLAVSTMGRVEFLRERGIGAHHVPLGYAPEHGCDMGSVRDIDVLFLGERRTFHRRLQLARLRRAGVPVTVLGDWSEPSYWGPDRTRLLNRTKVFLNIPRFAGEFAGLRFVLGMANKALVLSEPVYRSEPYVPGKHYVSASIDDMPGLIRHYLSHEEERSRIVDEAYRLTRECVTMAGSVGRLLRLLTSQLPDE